MFKCFINEINLLSKGTSKFYVNSNLALPLFNKLNNEHTCIFKIFNNNNKWKLDHHHHHIDIKHYLHIVWMAREIIFDSNLYIAIILMRTCVSGFIFIQHYIKSVFYPFLVAQVKCIFMYMQAFNKM